METKEQEQIKGQSIFTSHKHLGKILRDIRIKKGLSQEDMAKITPYCQSNISRLETKATLDDETLEFFAKAYNMSLEEIKNYEGDETYTIIFENNNFNEGSKSFVASTDSSTTNNYPIDKVVELYEKMIKVERKNSAAAGKKMVEMKQQIDTLQKEIEKLKKGRS